MFETFFYQPIVNLVIFIYNILPVESLGLTIIILSIVIKLVLLPFSKQQIKSQKVLQDLQPKIEEVKKKYASQKEEMGKAILELYKKNRVNPLSSCLPLLIQFPFLIAVFQVFRDNFSPESLDLIYSIVSRPESIKTFFLGINLSQPNVLIAFFAAVSQYFQTKTMMGKKKNSNDNQNNNFAETMNKQMLYMMPFLTFIFGLSLPSGLSLYWFMTTILTIFQQNFIFNKKDDQNDDGVIEGEVVK